MTNVLPDKPVGALINGLAILRYLSSANEPVGVTRVAKDLQLNPSTSFNLLKTLVHEGLVNFDEITKTYTIGLGLVELSKRALGRHSCVRVVRPYLQVIADRFHVTATLWLRIHGERVILMDLADSGSAIRVHMSIGQRLPMFIAAFGRCMAAAINLSDRELYEKFVSLRWENEPSFEAYLQDVKQCRADGFAIDRGFFAKGVTTIASAILDDLKRPVMAISAVGLSAQLTESNIAQIAAVIQSQSSRISSAISGQRFAI